MLSNTGTDPRAYMAPLGRHVIPMKAHATRTPNRAWPPGKASYAIIPEWTPGRIWPPWEGKLYKNIGPDPRAYMAPLGRHVMA